MSEEKSKLIPFTKELEEAIEADARRCERSFTRQVVAVLKTYYQIDDVEINRQNLEYLGDLLPKSKAPLPLIDTEKKKKRTA